MKIPVKPVAVERLLETVLTSNNFQNIILGGIGPAPAGKYRPWDILRHLQPPADFTPEEFWLAVKLARQPLYQRLPLNDSAGSPFKFLVFDLTLKLLHEIDRNASGAIKGSDQVTDPHTRDTYLLKSLMEEAITSSQLEGASTTRDVAKDMIQRGRKPRDRSEQMISNNYAAMQFIRKLRDEPLSPALVLELQRILTENAIDEPGAAGRFRRTDEDILVSDEIGTVLHRPPPARELARRMELMCRFANDTSDSPFVHPVIRSILLHFWLAYDHPFVDGNGRTARALFYWSMARQGYWLCEFISISRIIKKAPSSYARAFLYSETDDNDVTYFVLHQLRVITRAIGELHEYLARKADELRETQLFVRQSASVRNLLNHRQLALINHGLKNPGFTYTIESHRNSHGVRYDTARTDLLQLADHQLLERGKTGRKFWFMAPKDLRARLRKL